jgi:hypothetical protein
MLLPSLSSTDNVSSVTVTSIAFGTSISIAEILIPRLKQLCTDLSNHLFYLAEVGTAKAPTSLKTYWIKPELRDIFIPLNVHVRWFVTITGIKEKAISAVSVNCWHLVALPFLSANIEYLEMFRV